ncbi:MAG: asparagine synthase-related protein [archaeon]
MCGIGAIIDGDPKEIIKLMDPIRNRGESFNEHAVVGSSVLSCNRLKIVGRDTGKQPVANETGRIFAVMNGEIYNHHELREMLVLRGHRFCTGTDTEVLVHGYEEWRKELPKKLDGMFAFIIYDGESFLAARDPYGIKPLHWAVAGNTVYFASEAKQLLFAGRIMEVSAGSFVSGLTERKYYSFPERIITDSRETIIANLRRLFDSAVRKRCATDLPVAVFLSGGIDSTAVLATARKHHSRVATIVVGNSWDSPDCDYMVAMRYCRENGIPVISAQPPAEKELFRQIPEIIRITESAEPNLIKQAGLSLFLAKIAKDNGFKVVLCGEGADEIFCGYPEFRNIPLEQASLMSRRFFDHLHMTQLQRVDRTSMHHTVEVRVPFMDVDFAEYALNIPIKYRMDKQIFRAAMLDRLPHYIAYRKKVVLSEGMGLKGNSLDNGMFSSMLESEQDYYLKLYRSFGYTRKQVKAKPLVNRTHSCQDTTCSRILSVFMKKRYRRDRPTNTDKMLDRIKIAVDSNEPIRIIGFWGYGTKKRANPADIEACDHIKSLAHEIEEVYPPGLEVSYVFATKHAEFNGVQRSVIGSYTRDIRSLYRRYGFRHAELGDLWKRHGISFEKIEKTLSDMPVGWWGSVPAHKRIEKNARKHNKLLTPKDAAMRYYIMRELEREIFEKGFNRYLFHTYNDSTFNPILPRMPIIHLYARKGWANSPWFV